jgi:hypothetical protein
VHFFLKRAEIQVGQIFLPLWRFDSVAMFCSSSRNYSRKHVMVRFPLPRNISNQSPVKSMFNLESWICVECLEDLGPESHTMLLETNANIWHPRTQS